MKKIIFLDVLCCLFSFLFLYTGIMKLLDPEFFQSVLRKSILLRSAAFSLSYSIPMTELAIAACILIPRSRRIGLYGFAILMSIFTIYIGFMLYFQSNLPCTCGGIISEMSWRQHFRFNMLFTFLSLVALWLDKKIKKEQVKRCNILSYTI